MSKYKILDVEYGTEEVDFSSSWGGVVIDDPTPSRDFKSNPQGFYNSAESPMPTKNLEE